MDFSPVQWTFYTNSEDTWNGMYAACESATQSIEMEQFIFTDDTIGIRFAELFMQKVKEGVRVRLLCDCAGSFSFYNSPLAKKMIAAGVEIAFFNPISIATLHALSIWLFRDHRKILIIDGAVAFIGGVGIKDDFRTWRDTHVRVTGAIVSEIILSFDHMWWIAIRRQYARFKKTRDAVGGGFSLVVNAPHRKQRYLDKTILDAVRRANTYIYLTSPYFVPDRKLFRALRRAARRGVDVRILLPNASDHPYVDLASDAHFARAFRSGIRIFRYNAMLHAKTLAIDDEWSTVGSSNMDNLSSYFNHEANIVSTNPVFAAELREHFLQDTRTAREVDSKTWSLRPLWKKCLEKICLPFGKFF